jgi:tetratricopeptide (TPR) repeat protein
MNRPERLFTALLLIWISSQGFAAAQSPPAPLVLDAGQLWDFAETLEKQGEHYRAVTEYKRLIYFFPDSEQAARARLRIAVALLRGGEPGQAVASLESVRAASAVPERGGDVHYLLALALLERGRERPYPLRLEGIEAALTELAEIGSDWPGHTRTEGFVQAMRQPPELPEKSPLLAGTLSAILPGAGSFYTGRYAEGSLALFVNAVLIYATVNSFQRDQVPAGTIFGALALVFYGGSIYAAVNGAHKFNDRAQSSYLEEQRVKFGIVVTPAGGIAAAFGRDF